MCDFHERDLLDTPWPPLTFRVVVLVLNVHVFFLDIFITVLETIVCMDIGSARRAKCGAKTKSSP